MVKNSKVNKKVVNPLANFNFKLVGEPIKYGTIEESTISITSKDGKFSIDKHDVANALKILDDQAKTTGKVHKTIVRVMNCEKWFTVKSLDGNLNIRDFEDYYKDTVRNVNKFEKFGEVQITVLTYGNINKNIFKK